MYKEVEIYDHITHNVYPKSSFRVHIEANMYPKITFFIHVLCSEEYYSDFKSSEIVL